LIGQAARGGIPQARAWRGWFSCRPFISTTSKSLLAQATIGADNRV